jgi:hypothetical protein
MRASPHRDRPAAVRPRLAGAVVAGIGLTFFMEHVENLILA